MYTIIKIALFLFILCETLAFTLGVAIQSEIDKNSLIFQIRKETSALFKNRNVFGIFLSVVVFITLIPSYVVLFIISLLSIVLQVILKLWEYGKLKQ